MADATYQPKVYVTSAGDKHVIASGGELDVESGGALKLAGTQITATAAELNQVASVADPVLATPTAGKELVAGNKSVTGSSTVDLTGTLTSIDAAWATLGTAPGTGAGDPFLVSVSISGLNLTLNVWQDDAAAATAATTVYYGAIGNG